MYPHFVDGIITGQFRRLPITEIRKMVQEHYFGFEPLTELTCEENIILEDLLVKKLDERLNRETMELLCGPVYINRCGNTKSVELSVELYVRGENLDGDRKLDLLSSQEKMDLFFNPKKWLHTRINKPGLSYPATFYGNRNLLAGDGYFKSGDEFRKLLEKIRQRSDTKHLVVLDIGCGMGLALQDMKELDPDIETHGITMEQEPAMFSADYFHYMVAERMPLEFREKFHLIVSNISFRYFLFQHIALLNVVKALASGGYADISFSYDRIPETPESREYFLKQVSDAKSNYQTMEVLIKDTLAKLEVLREAGDIKITPSPNFYQQGMQGGLIIEKIRD